MLGPLEARFVAALRRLRRANARDLLDELRRQDIDLAYTTVNTVLKRLFKKGLVHRYAEAYRGGERYVYAYKDIEGQYIDWLLEGLTKAFGKQAVVRLANQINGTSPDLRRGSWRRRQRRRKSAPSTARDSASPASAAARRNGATHPQREQSAPSP